MDYNKTICEKVKEAIVKGELPASAVNLAMENPHMFRFYILPKIHKPRNPGRPIVFTCNCQTELIAMYLDRLPLPWSRTVAIQSCALIGPPTETIETTCIKISLLFAKNSSQQIIYPFFSFFHKMYVGTCMFVITLPITLVSLFQGNSFGLSYHIYFTDVFCRLY